MRVTSYLRQIFTRPNDLRENVLHTTFDTSFADLVWNHTLSEIVASFASQTTSQESRGKLESIVEIYKKASPEQKIQFVDILAKENFIEKIAMGVFYGAIDLETVAAFLDAYRDAIKRVSNFQHMKSLRAHLKPLAAPGAFQSNNYSSRPLRFASAVRNLVGGKQDVAQTVTNWLQGSIAIPGSEPLTDIGSLNRKGHFYQESFPPGRLLGTSLSLALHEIRWQEDGEEIVRKFNDGIAIILKQNSHLLYNLENDHPDREFRNGLAAYVRNADDRRQLGRFVAEMLPTDFTMEVDNRDWDCVIYTQDGSRYVDQWMNLASNGFQELGFKGLLEVPRQPDVVQNLEWVLSGLAVGYRDAPPKELKDVASYFWDVTDLKGTLLRIVANSPELQCLETGIRGYDFEGKVQALLKHYSGYLD